MLSIDEAIQQARYVADEHSDCWRNCENIEKCCKECEYEHEQLAEWLEELKKRRSEDYGYMADIHQSIGYRKALDDFVNNIKDELNRFEVENLDTCVLFDFIDRKAERLKAGVDNV